MLHLLKIGTCCTGGQVGVVIPCILNFVVQQAHSKSGSDVSPRKSTVCSEELGVHLLVMI